MNFLSDLHTHSIVSGHGYSTLLENINYCKENGIKILGTSEHGPKMSGSPHKWYFHNIQNIPRIINNIIILRGCEANILDTEGNPNYPINYELIIKLAIEKNILIEINFPDELIMNYPKKLINHFHQKGKLLDVDYTNI